MDKMIYLVRHGKIMCGEVKRYIGTTDLLLSEAGIDQAQILKAFFSNIILEKAYMSTLVRCVQTAEIILADRDIEKIQLKEFEEINMGVWENKTFDYIKKQHPQQFIDRGNNISDFEPLGGESFSRLQKRVMPVFENIVKTAIGNVLIVAHAGVNRVILSKLLEVPLNEIFNIRQPYGCVNELMWDQTYQRWQYKRTF